MRQCHGDDCTCDNAYILHRTEHDDFHKPQIDITDQHYETLPHPHKFKSRTEYDNRMKITQTDKPNTTQVSDTDGKDDDSNNEDEIEQNIEQIERMEQEPT